MFERFTDEARRTLALAQDEAKLLNHTYVGTEHILLALIREGRGVAARSLESLNVRHGAVRAEVVRIIGLGHAAPSGILPFTPRAKTVLEFALREALQFDHDYIGTEHILLGLIREGEGVAAEILRRLGADSKRARQTVIQQLTGYPAARYGESPSPSPFEEREKIVLSLLLAGQTTSGIANVLGVSKERVREIIQSIIQTLKDV